MTKRFSFLSILSSVLISALLLTGCSPSLSEIGKEEPTSNKKKSSIKVEDVKPIELSTYAEKAGAKLIGLKSSEFTVASSFTLEGKIEDSSLEGKDVWVRVIGQTSDDFEYYIPIKDSTFKQNITLFDGQGTYKVVISLPKQNDDNSFYEMTTLNVTNSSQKITRDIEMTPEGQSAGLSFAAPVKGYLEAKDQVVINGQVSEKYNGKYLMVYGTKDQNTWQVMTLVENGHFKLNFPLNYGKGQDQISVMVPDPKREGYYLDGGLFIVKNTSDANTTEMTYYQDYYDNNYKLTEPVASGETTNKTFHISGDYDMSKGKNSKIDQLIVDTKKGNLEASYLVPAKNGHFEGDFYLRFGPGEYKVTVAIPDDPGSYHSYFNYSGIASFTVKSDAKDERNLLPSRGIQSNAPEIKKLAASLTNGQSDDRAKSKAIYEYVAKNITYDMEKYHKDLFKLDDSALRTISKKTGVCQDYVFLTVALLRAAGIESHYITGEANGRHAWLQAKVDGEWILMDPTWGSGYVQNDQFIHHYDASYFDPDPTEFNKTHKREKVVY